MDVSLQIYPHIKLSSSSVSGSALHTVTQVYIPLGWCRLLRATRSNGGGAHIYGMQPFHTMLSEDQGHAAHGFCATLSLTLLGSDRLDGGSCIRTYPMIS